MIYIIRAKRCKRCGGTLLLERELEGVNICCLQCGAEYIVRLERKNSKPQEVHALTPTK